MQARRWPNLYHTPVQKASGRQGDPPVHDHRLEQLGADGFFCVGYSGVQPGKQLDLSYRGCRNRQSGTVLYGPGVRSHFAAMHENGVITRRLGLSLQAMPCDHSGKERRRPGKR